MTNEMGIGRRIAASAGNVAAVETLNHYYDALFIPAVALWGPWVGGSIVTAGAIVLNRVFIHAYNRSDLDWYGFEWIRSRIGTATSSWRLVLRIAYVSYLLFWCWWDPFAGFILLRGKMTSDAAFGVFDWVLLSGITVFGSSIWVMMIQLGISTLRHLFR